MSSSQETINADLSPDSSASKEAMFEPKPKPKVIRVLTVLAYVLSVSMAAILLSIYYIFMWEGHPHIGALTSFNDSKLVVPSPHIARFELETDLVPGVNLSASELPNVVGDHWKKEMQQQITASETELISNPTQLTTPESMSSTSEWTSDFDDNVLGPAPENTFLKKLLKYK